MRPLPRDDHELPACFNTTLIYAQRFTVVPQVNEAISGSKTARGPYPEPTTSLYVVRRAERTNGNPVGDVVPLHQVRAPLDLVPKFGKQADPHVTKETSLHCYQEFYINKYHTKELFWALSPLLGEVDDDEDEGMEDNENDDENDEGGEDGDENDEDNEDDGGDDGLGSDGGGSDDDNGDNDDDDGDSDDDDSDDADGAGDDNDNDGLESNDDDDDDGGVNSGGNIFEYLD